MTVSETLDKIYDALSKATEVNVDPAGGKVRTAPLIVINITFQVGVGTPTQHLSAESVGDDKPAENPGVARSTDGADNRVSYG